MTAHAMEEEIFTGKMDFALWKKMLRFALPHRGKLLSVMALGVTVSVCDMVFAALTGWIVDSVTQQGAAAHFSHFVLAYAIMIAVFVTCIFSFINIAGRITVCISY